MRMYKVFYYVDGERSFIYCDSFAEVERALASLEVGTRYSVYRLEGEEGEYQMYRSGTTR